MEGNLFNGVKIEWDLLQVIPRSLARVKRSKLTFIAKSEALQKRQLFKVMTFRLLNSTDL